MLFSIILPAYNAEKFIRKAIQSITSQKFQDYEIIVVNDGSTDGTLYILQELSRDDEHIVILEQDNKGQFVSRLNAIAKAKGEYVLFLDADDWYFENSLQILAKELKNYEYPDCCYYGFQHMDVNGRKVRDPIVDDNIYIASNKRDIFLKYAIGESYEYLFRKAVKRNCFQSFDYAEYQYLRTGEDHILTFEILKNCKKVVFITDVLYAYCINPLSTVHTQNYNNYKPDNTLGQNLVKYVDPFFSDEDKENLRVRYIQKECYRVRRIAGFSTSQKNKNRLYNQMQNGEWYKNYLTKNDGGGTMT